MDCDNKGKIKPTAPPEFRRGALASVIGITASGERRGEHWGRFSAGTVYLVEFEDGEVLDVHQSRLKLAEA